MQQVIKKIDFCRPHADSKIKDLSLDRYDYSRAYARAKNIDLDLFISEKRPFTDLVHLKQFNGSWRISNEINSELTGFIPTEDFYLLLRGDYSRLDSILSLFIPTSEFRYNLYLHEKVTVFSVRYAYIAGFAVFWRKFDDRWYRCKEEECEWISLPISSNGLKHLPHGYPKLIIHLQLDR